MAVFNGTEFNLFLVESTNKKVGNVTSNSLSIDTETFDISSKDSNGWREFMGGFRTFSMEVEGVIDFQKSGVANSDLLADIIVARLPVLLVSKNAVNGDTTFQGQGILTNLQFTSPMEDTPTFTATFQGSGALTIGTNA